MLQVYQATDIGCVRATNEDSLAVFEPQVYVVADGMGGEAAGEVASRILTETLQQVLGQRETVDSQELAQAIQQGNAAILQCVQEHPEYQGMGTTATALHAEAGTFALQPGDQLLLATDGLMKHVTDEEIAAALQQRAADPARQLVDMALNAGGSDNVTAIVVVLPS